MCRFDVIYVSILALPFSKWVGGESLLGEKMTWTVFLHYWEMRSTPSYLLISLGTIYTGPWTLFSQKRWDKNFFPAFFVECSLMTAPPLVPTLEFLLDQVLFTPAHGPKQKAQHFLFTANWPKNYSFQH